MEKQLMYKGKPICFFVIDRLAQGFPKDQVCGMFRAFFEMNSRDNEILELAEGKDQEIKERKEQILKKIDDTNLTTRVVDYIDTLDEAAKGAETPTDKAKLFGVLSQYINLIKPKLEETHITEMNQTNIFVLNAPLIENLLEDGVIQIKDNERFISIYKDVLPVFDAKYFIRPPKQLPPGRKEEKADA